MGGGGVSTRVLPRGSVGPVCAAPSSVASSYPPSFRRAPASTALFHHCGHARAHRNATSQRRRSSLRLCDPDPAPPLQPPPRRRLVPCPLRLRGCRRRRGRPVSMPVLRGRPAPPPSYLRRRGRRVASARAQPRQLTARTPSTTPCRQVCGPSGGWRVGGWAHPVGLRRERGEEEEVRCPHLGQVLEQRG